MILLLIALAAIIVSVLLRIDRRLAHVEEAIQRGTYEIRELRLKSRTRVAQAAVQSGAVSHEQQLQRLGRATAARRIVVGGDDEAEQKQKMVRASHVGVERRGGDDRDS